jgi:hypothetical protein
MASGRQRYCLDISGYVYIKVDDLLIVVACSYSLH